MSDYDNGYDDGYRAGMQKMREVGQTRIEELEALRDALTNKIHKLVFLLDDQLGTPCEQIRHQQQVEELEAKVRELEEYKWMYEELCK